MRKTIRPRTSQSLGVAFTVALLCCAVAPAVADTRPPSSDTPATVSVDPLPTVQINGVVWAQAIVGNTVYATGSFSKARPAGAKAGVNETSRANLLAYDITTGNLITSFNHSLNAQGLAIAVSPDQKELYVGGDFTTVDGAAHSHLAAFSLPSGALLTNFTAGPKGKVKALTATNTAVYAGGGFNSTSSGARRTNLAAYSSTGTLLSWGPTADNNVAAMVMSPDQSLVVVGGSFSHLNGITYHALAAISASTGAPVPWASQSDSFPVRNDSTSSGITTLATDGTAIYFGAFNYQQIGQPGKVEGTGAISPVDGHLLWVDDCHGDTYSVFPIGQVLYSSGHAHDCQPIGGFPDTNPRVWHHGLAQTTYATHTNGHATGGYTSFQGLPASTLLDWFPKFSIGSYTGIYQAGWSVTGNSNYVAYGGEFPKVNGVAQQGIVRFAISSIAPNKYGPTAYTATAASAPAASVVGTSTVTVNTTWDPDNAVLTYAVYRDNGSTPIYTTTADTRFWNTPPFTFLDSGLVPGSTHTYKVVVTDPFGNKTTK